MTKVLLSGSVAMGMLTACANLPAIADRPPLEFAFSSGIDGFEVTLANPSAYDRCIASESWPNAAGWIHYSSDVVFVDAGSERYPLRDRNVGYCPGGCEQVRIPAKGSVSARLPYIEFPGLTAPPPPNAKLSLRPAETPCTR